MDKSSRQADKIEITPAMEQAGIAVLEDSGYMDEADSGFTLLPCRVFEAMWRCRQREIAGQISGTDPVPLKEDTGNG